METIYYLREKLWYIWKQKEGSSVSELKSTRDLSLRRKKKIAHRYKTFPSTSRLK